MLFLSWETAQGREPTKKFARGLLAAALGAPGKQTCENVKIKQRLVTLCLV